LQGNSNSTDHIGTVELARLLEESRRPGESAPDAKSVHPHLASCSSCREQFEQLNSLDRQLQNLRVNPALPSSVQGDCPGPSVWRQIVVGPTPPEQTLSFIKHASQCDHCGPLLRKALAESIDLDRELTEAERVHIASLESASPEWQQQLARRIVGTQDPSLALYSSPTRQESWGHISWWQKWLSLPRLAMAGASLLLVLGVGLWLALHPTLYQSLFRRDQPAAAKELLARAYTEKRSLELRLAGAAYGPQRISRGPATSFTDRPTTLSRAEALIATQLESHPSDPSWLQAKGEADLLDGRYDPAVDTLRRALQLDPNSPAILIDLATAYSQRAQQEGRNEDFAAAYEHLSQALRLHPEDPVALFNRAIVAEHQFLYHQAIEDWEHYLRVDPSSQWAEEAHMRAEAVREKLKEHQSQAKPLLSPAELTASLSDADLAAKVDRRIDEYLDQAVLSWLPQAFPDNGSDARSPAARGLFFLAELATRQHGDRWLADLLRQSSDSDFPQAAAALARAFNANRSGEYDVARQQADRAEDLFRASGNAGGMLRAQFEHIYADQIDRHSETCQRRATAALHEAEKYPYSWLQIQLGLEQGVCAGVMGDIGILAKASLRAAERARQSNHGALYLRALDFGAAARFETGDKPGAWELLQVALDRFWSGQFPAMQGYNLYQVDGSWGANQQPNRSLAVWREAVALIESDEDMLLRAWARGYMANAAAAAQQPQIATEQYTEAARLFALAPRTDASHGYVLETEIRIAQLEARLGHFDDAITRLTEIQDQIRPLSNNYLVQMFYSTLGELQLRRHREADAEQALRPALALAEQSLATLKSDAERAIWSQNAAPAYLALVQAELLQGRSQEALATYERLLGAAQYVPAGSQPEPSIANETADQSLLSSPGLASPETVLTYAVLPDGLAIWASEDGNLKTRWFPGNTDDLQELAVRFHELCSDPKSELSALRRDARSLFDALLAPIEQTITPGRALVIEAEGWLASIPFEALIDANDRYLIERSAIVHSLGRDSQSRLRKNQESPGISANLRALVVASDASSPLDGLVPLPDVAAEAHIVARNFHSAHVLEGKESTLRAVLDDLPNAAVFHFAGHSYGTPEKSGLTLSGGDAQGNSPELIDATVVRRLRLQSLELAVLSACGTASGSGGPSGFDSVTDALLRQGVPHVVASRWSVESIGLKGFVEDFYRNAVSGQTVSDSLRLTSRKMLSNRNTSHPYYWSAFAAYGQP
jgi:CHAT domain-containing protein